MPVPFATYHPGPTFDVLGTTDGQEIIQVNGAKTYRDDGQIRFTTVSVSQEGVDKNIFDVIADWIDPDAAVYPYDIVHPPGTHRRAGGGRGPGPDGVLAGQRHRGGAARARTTT